MEDKSVQSEHWPVSQRMLLCTTLLASQVSKRLKNLKRRKEWMALMQMRTFSMSAIMKLAKHGEINTQTLHV